MVASAVINQLDAARSTNLQPFINYQACGAANKKTSPLRNRNLPDINAKTGRMIAGMKKFIAILPTRGPNREIRSSY